MLLALIYKLFIVLLFILSLPVQVIIAFVVCFFSGLPIIYTQKRIGRDGKPFPLYKFRTMIHNAEAVKNKYLQMNEAKGPVFKIHNDPRFTPIGMFLSHTGLDELPQLYNVFLGHMAFIGPRPLPIHEAKKLKPWQQKRHVIKPGIISPWILDGYHKKSFEEWMESDIAYTKQKSILYDFSLTIQSVFLIITLLLKEMGLQLHSGKRRTETHT